MFKKLQGLIAGIIIGVTLTGGIVLAKNSSEWIEVLYSDIKIYVDGIKIEPKDANGSRVEPFIYNGTTYLPVRAVGQALDKTVSWDGMTQSVYIGERPGDILSLTEACPPYDGEKYEIHKSSDSKYVTVAGEKYTDVLTLGTGGGYVGDSVRGNALFNLNAQYDTLTFEIGREDTSSKKDTTLNIYLDGKLSKTYEIGAESLPKKVSVNLNKALQMKMEIIGKGGKYALINAVIE